MSPYLYRGARTAFRRAGKLFPAAAGAAVSADPHTRMQAGTAFCQQAALPLKNAGSQAMCIVLWIARCIADLAGA